MSELLYALQQMTELKKRPKNCYVKPIYYMIYADRQNPATFSDVILCQHQVSV